MVRERYVEGKIRVSDSTPVWDESEDKEKKFHLGPNFQLYLTTQ